MVNRWNTTSRWVRALAWAQCHYIALPILILQMVVDNGIISVNITGVALGFHFISAVIFTVLGTRTTILLTSMLVITFGMDMGTCAMFGLAATPGRTWKYQSSKVPAAIAGSILGGINMLLTFFVLFPASITLEEPKSDVPDSQLVEVCHASLRPSSADKIDFKEDKSEGEARNLNLDVRCLLISYLIADWRQLGIWQKMEEGERGGLKSRLMATLWDRWDQAHPNPLENQVLLTKQKQGLQRWLAKKDTKPLLLNLYFHIVSAELDLAARWNTLLSHETRAHAMELAWYAKRIEVETDYTSTLSKYRSHVKELMRQRHEAHAIMGFKVWKSKEKPGLLFRYGHYINTRSHTELCERLGQLRTMDEYEDEEIHRKAVEVLRALVSIPQ